MGPAFGRAGGEQWNRVISPDRALPLLGTAG